MILRLFYIVIQLLALNRSLRKDCDSIVIENYIDVDPLAGFDAPEIIQSYEDDLSEKIEEAIRKVKNPDIRNSAGKLKDFLAK